MRVFTYIIVLFLIFNSCSSQKDEQNKLEINWGLIDNLTGEKEQALWQISITNIGENTLPNSGWSLYYNHIYTQTCEANSGMEAKYINGDLRMLKPTTEFIPLEKNKSFTFKVWSDGSVLNFTDAPLGFYLVMDDKPDVGIPCKLNIAELPKKNLNRYKGEPLPIHSAEIAYKENENSHLLGSDEFCPVVPTPLKFMQTDQYYTLGKEINLVYDTQFLNEALFLEKKLNKLYKGQLTLNNREKGNVHLKYTEFQGSTEAYNLLVNEQGITIEATNTAGVFYGIQSLLSLMPIGVWETGQEEIKIKHTEINDSPRYKYRGVFLDVARNFHPKENVLKLLDAMAFYKMNKFHFHLCDDEGWRLEIPDLPELTGYGAFRGHSENESKYLYPSFGSGPIPDPETSHGSGYYTQADFIEILEYAKERHIEVIPEIDVPGHARAAIRSMQIRYENYMAENDTAKALAYLLTDLNDTSSYMSVQGWTDNVVDVGLESTYKFLDKVVQELSMLYAKANAPLNIIHTGGDEVPHGVWQGSPACQEILVKHQEYTKPKQLAHYFTLRFANILADYNIRAAGWEEFALIHEDDIKPNLALVDSKLIPYAWNNMWDSGAEDLAYQLANSGYEVVLAHVTNFYFDLAYHKHPKEPGYYWGNFINTKHPWEYTPNDITKCAEIDCYGNVIDRKKLTKQMIPLSTEGKKNILGVQGQLWSENNLGLTRMEYFYFPKLLGLAERAWAPQPTWARIENDSQRAIAKEKAWNEFANTLGQRDLPRLDYMNGGYLFRVPTPGVNNAENQLTANVRFPGLTIKYRLPQTNEWIEYENSIPSNPGTAFKTFTPSGRMSRAEQMQ